MRLPAWVVIAGREVDAMFRLPVGWVVAAAFAALSGLAFGLVVLREGEAATMRPFFGLASGLLVAICPAVSMRSFAEESRTGALDLVRAGPVGDLALAAGKHLGAVASLALMLLPSLSLAVALASVSEPAPSWGPIASGYAALLLSGMLYLAVGLVASAATSSQTLAFLAALMALVVVQLGVSRLAMVLGPPWAERVLGLSVPLRAARMSSGLIEAADVAFFVGWSVWLVVVAGVLVGLRRWR